MQKMKELGVVNRSGADYGPNYSCDGIPPNQKPKGEKRYDVEGLSILFRYYKEGLKASDIGGLAEAQAKTQQTVAGIAGNALHPLAQSATELYKKHIQPMNKIDKAHWDKRLKDDCLYVDGEDFPKVLLYTVLKEDSNDMPGVNPPCFYAQGAYGNGGAAGQINRVVGGNPSQYNKDPVALNLRWGAYGSKRIFRNDGNVHDFGLYQGDRLRVAPSQLAQALANGYHIIGVGLGDWNHHIHNQVVNVNAYWPIYLFWGPGGFMYQGYNRFSPLGPADLVRDAPTKSEMNIGGIEECSAGTHQAMLLGYAHTKQQVDAVEIRQFAPTTAPPRNAHQIALQPPPVYSMVFEGITTLIMSFIAERNMFAAAPWLVYNWQ